MNSVDPFGWTPLIQAAHVGAYVAIHISALLMSLLSPAGSGSVAFCSTMALTPEWRHMTERCDFDEHNWGLEEVPADDLVSH